MSIFKKLYAAITGHATNVGNDIVDSQGLVILEQEIRNSEKAVAKSKAALAGVSADHKKAVRDVAKIEADIETYTGHASAALDKEDEALATQCAERVAKLQGQLAQQTSLRDRYAKTVDKIKADITKGNSSIEEIKFRHKTAVARDLSHKAHAQLSQASTGVNSGVSTALESLDRIERKQEADELLLESAEELDAELSGDSLDDQLAAANIGSTTSNAASILDSLRREKK